MHSEIGLRWQDLQMAQYPNTGLPAVQLTERQNCGLSSSLVCACTAQAHSV